MVLAPTIIGLIGFFTLVTLAAPVALAMRAVPAWLLQRRERRVVFHQAACATLADQLASMPLGDTNYPRLFAALVDNRRAIQALAPQLPVPTLPASADTLPLAV